MAMLLNNIWQRFRALLRQFITNGDFSESHNARASNLLSAYGIRLVEKDSHKNARPWHDDEIALLDETLYLLGSTFYGPFLTKPLNVWIDRLPGGGSYGHQWLQLGEPGHDLSILYRIFLHEATHASNEYRGWPYETKYCMRPGLDWRREGNRWIHPRQQGSPPEPGNWETLPVQTRDVSTAPGEDLAETVRYFVHSVRNERAWLWPLDLSEPPLYLWDTSPTRFIFVRDCFLRLPPDHIWYRRLADEVEARVASWLAD